MKTKLIENAGIANTLLWTMSIVSGVSVANLYYSQPLLNRIGADMRVDEFTANLIPMITQIGYALGLLFVIPLGDLYKRRNIILIDFSVLIVALLAMGMACNVYVLLVSSLFIGFCSVIPQIFMPMAAQFSTPETKSRNVGIVLSGLLTGILASRVVSGVVGEYFGWRTIYYMASVMMFMAILVVLRNLPDVPVNFHGRYVDLMRSLFVLVKKYRMLRISALRSALCFGSFLGLWSCLTFKMSAEPFCAGNNVIGLLGLCGIAGVIVATFLGKYIHRYGVYSFNIIGCLLIIASWILLYLAGSFYWGIIAGIILIDIGMQCVQLSNQSTIFSLDQKASSRINTVFMTTYFIGGATGTFLAGAAWQFGGWTGVCLAGSLLTLFSLLITLFSRR